MHAIPKVFVKKSNTSNNDLEDNNDNNDNNDIGSVNGSDVVDFYCSIFSDSDSKIITKNNNDNNNDDNNNIDDNNMFYCDICNININKNNKQEHYLSVSHQINDTNNEIPKKQYFLQTGNRGYQILLKKGWNEMGLGKNEQGILDPIKTRIKNDRLGIGITPLCKEKISHKILNSKKARPNLYHRTIPNVENLNIFQALHALRTTPEQKRGISKRHREILLKRDRIKHDLLYRELYRD